MVIQIEEWVSEWLSLTAFFGTADIGVHLVHTNWGGNVGIMKN